MPNDNREVKFAYDRLSFYPNLLLSIGLFPSLAEVDEKYRRKKKIKVMTFSVKAARRKGKHGIFLNGCCEIVMFNKLTMFEEEFKNIFKKEFIIWDMEILEVKYFDGVVQDGDFHEHFKTLLEEKELSRGTSRYPEYKNRINTEIGTLALMKDGEHNGNMDRLSLSYLQCKARQEMYKLLVTHSEKVISFFVDTVRLAEDIEELHNKDIWRTA